MKKILPRYKKERVSEMKRWARYLKRAREEELDRLNLAIVAANNHYAGFGPGTANTFRKMLTCQKLHGIMLRLSIQ